MLVLILLFVSFKKPIVPPPTSSHLKKITLDLASFVPPVPKQKPKPIIKPKPKLTPKAPNQPIVKKPTVAKKQQPSKVQLPKESKTIAKTKSKTTHESNTTKVVKTKVIKKHTQKIKVAKKTKKHKVKKVTKRRYTKKVHKRKYKTHKKRSSLASALAPSSNYKSMYKRPTSSSFSMQTIRKLYGKEYDGFSAKQKEFIRMNLGLIYRITQRTLIRNGYPEVAIRTHQQGTNVVSFYLHPNGDISHLRLKRRIGYSALDKNTLEVIRIAYKDYPLPAKTTKIVFYVTYNIRLQMN
jgi:TonB family protein